MSIYWGGAGRALSSAIRLPPDAVSTSLIGAGAAGASGAAGAAGATGAFGIGLAGFGWTVALTGETIELDF